MSVVFPHKDKTMTNKTKINTSLLLFILLTLLSCGGDDSTTPAPEQPSITSTTASGFSFTWNDSGAPIRVQVSENENFSALTIDSVYESSPGLVNGLKSGTQYFMRAQHANTASPFTETLQVSTNELVAPTNLVVSEIFGDSFKVSWPDIEGVTFSIDVSAEQTFNSFIEGYEGLALEDNQVTVSAPQILTTYYFRVRSQNGSQSSENSETGMATTDDRLIFRLSSSAFEANAKIPAKYACQAASTPLSWKNPPSGTVSLTLIMNDLDFMNGYNHWVIFDIPTAVTELVEGVSMSSNLPAGAVEGRNDLGRTGYFGPCPPAGESHRYVYTLFALDKKLNLGSGTNEVALLNAIEGHIIGQKTLTGLFN